MKFIALQIAATTNIDSLAVTLAVCAILSLAFFGRVPRLLGWLLGAAVLAMLFKGDAVAATLGNSVGALAGPLLTLGLIIMGLRIMTRGFRTKCRYCGEWSENCRCRRATW
jgi:hypothetical protein